MDELPFLSATPSSSISQTNPRPRTDSASVIQQADVSSSRPALLAHDALGPLLFEALDGFFFTINHNFELDFISDNVGQYLKFTQEELAGRNLYYCVHPSDVGEFDKAWTKKDAGDALAAATNGESSRGRTFLCRMRTNDETCPYINMVVSAALHRDSSGNDKTFLICIARRPPSNEFKDKPALLGFDQFSSRINLQYDIESFDASHVKCEVLNTSFQGKNFRDYVHHHDIPLVLRHFQEVIEKGESKSAVYRFCLHDDVYAFINTQSKLFSNTSTGVSESILSTHTIVRIIENATDLNGNASTRLVKSIISSNRDLQKNKTAAAKALPPTPPPIGTQFALTMLGMHKNPSNSLQQHVSNTLDTLQHVQNSFSTPPPTALEKPIIPKPSTLENVSSSETVEFGSKRAPCSPSVGSGSSDLALPSPGNSLDVFFSSISPSNDMNGLFQALPSPAGQKKSDTPEPSTPSRSSLRLRQLLSTKSPSQSLQPSNSFDDPGQHDESPSTTNFSPSSPSRRRRKGSAVEGTPTCPPQPGDLLLKQILGRQPETNDENNADGQTLNTRSGSSSKLRSDIFLRTLLNDEVRPQKVVVEAPFIYGTRHRSSGGATHLLGRSSVKSQFSLDTDDPSVSKKRLRQNSHTFGSRSQPMTTLTLPARKSSRPKRDPSDYLLFNPQSTLSENSLDSFFDSNPTPEQSTSQTSRQASRKRPVDPEESAQSPRKLPKLLLKDEVKVECTEHPVISPSVALAATRPLNPAIIKTEPGTFDLLSPFEKTIPSSTTQSPLLRSLIRTPQGSSLTTKKDAPLYDLLQNLESNDTSIFSTKKTTGTSLDQYLSPQTVKTPVPKDDYLAALLSADPQQPSEISFIPALKQQQALPPTLVRSTSTSSESSRIAAIFNDLYNSTSAASSNITDDFLSLLDNKDFLESLTDSSTIDSILSENSTSVIQPSFPSSVPKHSEKDEKAISEIYKTLVTSFNPGPTSLDLPGDNSPFNSITGDFLFPETNPPNRTVNSDPLMSNYRQQPPSTYSYPTPQQSSSNTSQFSDGLSMDNSNIFPPNGTHLENNSMMMYSQQTPTHLQHHSVPSHYFRQASQSQQPSMYNNFGPPNQVAPGYYPMQQQRMSPAKRSALMHSPRTAQQTNQQLQLHMSMNMQANQQQHRPMMNTYNGAASSIPQDFHQYSSPMMATNSLDLFMSPPPSTQQRHANAIQQPYPNMNAVGSSQPQNSQHSNTMANLTPMECRQSDELNNTMMNCLSFQPARCTSEFVKKQLQNTIQGRQKPAGGKDMSAGTTGHKIVSATNLDPNQKGAYFRSQLSTPPLPTGIRSQQQPPQGKTTM